MWGCSIQILTNAGGQARTLIGHGREANQGRERGQDGTLSTGTES